MWVMDTLTALTAQLLPLVPPAVALLLWLALPLAGKVDFGLRALVVIAITAVLVLVAGFAHDSPRPFVLDPSHPALFAHAPDNGFPSDHTAYSAAAALLIVYLRRRLGLALLAVAAVGGLARVASNVHHLQDIVASVVIAVLANAAALVLFNAVRRSRPGPAGARGVSRPRSHR